MKYKAGSPLFAPENPASLAAYPPIGPQPISARLQYDGRPTLTGLRDCGRRVHPGFFIDADGGFGQLTTLLEQALDILADEIGL